MGINFQNPFYHRKSITDKEQFYGRKKESREIFNLLKVCECCSLIGERRIGKSSFLKYISHPEVQSGYGLNSEEYILVFFNFLGYASLTQNEFWQLVLEEISDKIADIELKSKIQLICEDEKIKTSEIYQLAREMKERGVKVILLFDEFEYATSNPNFDLSLFGGLRHLADNYDLAYVIASTKELSDLSYAKKDVIGSPFFNIFSTFYLGPFSNEEALEMVKKPLEGSGISFIQNDIDFVFRLGGFHPFFLQLACYHLVEVYKSEEMEEEKIRFKYTKERFDKEAVKHFEYYWDNSDDGEKIVFAALGLLGKEGFKKGRLKEVIDSEGLKSLEKRGLIIEEQVFSEVFKEWIIEEITSQRETVSFEEWIDEIKLKGKMNEVASAIRSTLSKVNPKYWEMLTKWVSRPENLEKGKKLLETIFGGA